MASNDMNSWDDDPDELLRQRWQQTFANFKVEAHASLRERILSALPAGHRRRRAYRIVGLLLLVSVGLLYPFRIGEYSYSGGNVTTVRRITPNGPLSNVRILPAKSSTGWSVPPHLPVGDSPGRESIVNRQPVLNSPTGTRVPVYGVGTPFGSGTTPKSSSTDQVRLRPSAGLRLRATAADELRAASVRPAGTKRPVQLAVPVATIGSEPVLAPVGQSVRGDKSPLSTIQPFQLSVDQPLTNVIQPVYVRLGPIGILPLFSHLSPLPGHLPIIAVVPSHPVGALVAHRRRQWFAEVVPLSTFQWMNVPPVATAYLSQMKAPAAFSLATWGYQVNGGIRWQHWQVHLSLGQIRRWAYYTVNENQFRVVPRPDNPNQLVRETYSVAENVLLPMIGVGLSKETLLDRGRYAVDWGGQATYLPTGQQAMISLRGGVGRRLAMSQALELQVGLRAEYGLNRLLSEQQQVVIHPLLIGIGFRIQPRSFK